jgi:hypothetical protein
MLDTVPDTVELTDVIEPLPVKPATVVLLLDSDTLKLSGRVRVNIHCDLQLACANSAPIISLQLFNQSDDPTRSVTLLWDDHSGETKNATLVNDGSSSAMGGRVTSSWYVFNRTDDGSAASLSIDPAAGITLMRFEVNGELEDQDGVGFAVQDGVVFSTSSCLTSADPPKGRFDIAVRDHSESVGTS